MAVVSLTANTPYTLNVTYNGQVVVVTLLTGTIGNTGSVLVTTSTAFNATAVWPGIVLGRNGSAPTCFSNYVVQSSTGARTDYMQGGQGGQVGQWVDVKGLGDSTSLSGTIRGGANPVCSGDHGVGLLPQQTAPFSVALQWTATGTIICPYACVLFLSCDCDEHNWLSHVDVVDLIVELLLFWRCFILS